MTPRNRIRDCWMLVAEGETAHFCSATPISAAVEEARAERKIIRRPVYIHPMPLQEGETA